MPKRTIYALALEIDRTLSLNLSNGEFEALSNYLGYYSDKLKVAQELMKMHPRDVIFLIKKEQSK